MEPNLVLINNQFRKRISYFRFFDESMSSPSRFRLLLLLGVLELLELDCVGLLCEADDELEFRVFPINDPNI